MSFNSHAYHVEKMLLPNYLASPGVLNTTTWQHTETGLELAKKTDQTPFIGIIMGHVSPFRLKCGPVGNHMNSDVSPLLKSKYQFHLCCPADHELGMDYETSISVLDVWQKQVGKSGECKNMLIEDVMGTMLRCVKSIFNMREDTVPNSPHGQSVENTPQMDEETRNWPVPDQFASEFDEIKYNYQVIPLPLYHDGHLVEPSMANEAINGAIVEVQFHIHHWKIKQFDSFQANVEKVEILCPGPVHHTSSYKRPRPKEKDNERELNSALDKLTVKEIIAAVGDNNLKRVEKRKRSDLVATVQRLMETHIPIISAANSKAAQSHDAHLSSHAPFENALNQLTVNEIISAVHEFKLSRAEKRNRNSLLSSVRHSALLQSVVVSAADAKAAHLQDCEEQQLKKMWLQEERQISAQASF
ncbi:uncharacterized protein F5147DRAFT_789267 [Suillus discolor]|uniref:Uncharacterized protein n=1 Tax=Suillus discolor TaxID=1912936 RepID=A0A9P7JX25_9AGAM|nr:uncharacterized protein F5147DRAFT_789267 [Suillus discolor]KAG2113590.1 hypothetical protein F5147DRAFT_789267 [Suillus discolor]